ncbi:phospholipase-like protein [Tanacetum coccineum]
MDMHGYEVPHVLVTCRSRQIDDENDDDENVPLNYSINNDLSIQFGREEFCLVTGLRFGVENRKEYDTQANLPFRRRVFPSHLDGQPITGIDIADAIVGPTFAELYDNDVVGLCCLGILQLVLLGVENRRNVPEWLLRIANDRVAWNKYPWGSYVWPTLYSQLRNATVRRWGPLYVDQPTNEDDRTTYSIFGYTWAFKTWILESFRVNAIRYFDRFNRYPRVAAWRKKKGRFTAEMVFPFFEGNIPVARLTPDDFEARSDWWISSKAYFDGFIDQVERVPFDLSRQNMYEIPSGIYRQEEMNARSVRQENTVPIIVGQHYGLSDFSEFRSMQDGPSSFNGHENMGAPPNFQTPMRSQPSSSDWQRQMPEQSASHYWRPSSHPGSYYSFGQPPSHMVRPNLQTTIETQHDVEAIVDQNIPNRGRRQQVPSKYLVTPFTVQAPTTMVPKQRVSKTTNKGNTANLSPLNLGGVFEGYNEEENNVTFFPDSLGGVGNITDDAEVQFFVGCACNSNDEFAHLFVSEQKNMFFNFFESTTLENEGPSNQEIPSSHLNDSLHMQNEPHFSNPESSFAFRSNEYNTDDVVNENPQNKIHKWQKFMSFEPDIPETPIYKAKPNISKQYSQQSEVEKTQTYPNHRNANKKVIGHLLTPKLQDRSRNLRGKDIQQDILLEYKIHISYQQAMKGKHYGIQQVRGSPYEAFEMLPFRTSLLSTPRAYRSMLRIKGNIQGTNLLAVVPWMETIRLCQLHLVYAKGKQHMNSWMELLIRKRPLNANWTVAYTSTISVHPENNQFIIMNDPHVIGTLDGSTRPYPSWNDVVELVLKDGHERIALYKYDVRNNRLGSKQSGKKKMKSATWVVKGVNAYQYEVSDGQYIREVNLQTGICGCRKWQLSGLPCGHVIAITRFLGLTDCVYYVADWFKKPKYQATYSESIHSLGNMQQWEFPENIQKAIPPRMDNPQPGRPKNTNRIQSQGEEPRIIRCTRCTQTGHRRDQCGQPFVVQPPVNIRTHNDQQFTQNNQPSFNNPTQQFDNTFNNINHYTSQQYADTTYPSQPYCQTPYPSQPYDQHFANTSQPYTGHYTESSQMYEQYNSQQYDAQHLDDINTNGSNNLAKVCWKLQIFVAHTPIDLSTVLIPNDGSFEQSLAGVISEATKIKLEESLKYLHQMQKRKNKKFDYYGLWGELAQYKLEIYIDHIGVNFVIHKYIFPNASLAEMMNHVITDYSSEDEGIIRQETQNDYTSDQMVEWAEQEHFEYEETNVACPKIDLSSMLIHNNRSKEESFGEAIDEEAILEEQILDLMHRFADRFTNRRVEINNLMVLHDHPLVDYGKYALGCMTGADMKKCVHLKSVRDELLRSMEEKRQLMTNYRDM